MGHSTWEFFTRQTTILDFHCHAIPKSAFLLATSQRHIRLLGVSGEKTAKAGCRPWAYITRQTTKLTLSSPKSPTPLATSKTTDAKIEGGWATLVARAGPRPWECFTRQTTSSEPISPRHRQNPYSSSQRANDEMRFLGEAGASRLQGGRRPWECITRQTTS